MISAAILFVFPACMIFATIYDLTTMTIPNKVILALLAGFAVLAPLAGMGLSTIAWHVGIAFLICLAGFGLWMLRVFGAGDAKLLAASSLWLGPAQTAPYLAFVGLIGGAAVILIMLFRRQMLPAFLVQVDWVHKLHQPKAAVPYGVALAPAALLVFLESPLAKYALSGAPI